MFWPVNSPLRGGSIAKHLADMRRCCGAISQLSSAALCALLGPLRRRRKSAFLPAISSSGPSPSLVWPSSPSAGILLTSYAFPITDGPPRSIRSFPIIRLELRIRSGFDSDLVASGAEPCNKSRGESQGRGNACNAGEPSEMVEQLAKHGAPDHAAKEIASEIGAAGNPAVCPCRLPDEASSAGLRKKGPDPDQHHPGEHIRKVR